MKSDVTALFVAVHNGNMTLVKKLLSHGADANHKLFRGFSLTAAVREDHFEIFEMLLKAGASQPACEEALLEASCHGRGGKLIKLLMDSDQIRLHIVVHALVTACCRGFTDIVDTLLKSLYLSCPNLGDLNLNSCKNLLPEKLVLQCPKLESVHAIGCQDPLIQAVQTQVSSDSVPLENRYSSKRMADGLKRVGIPFNFNQQSPYVGKSSWKVRKRRCTVLVE